MNKVKDDNRLLLRKLLRLAIPMMIANAFSNLISLVNNITVGSLGTEQLSGVAIANQIINVYNLCIYGAVSGAEIFGTQFHGKSDHENVRNVFRFKIMLMVALTALAVLVFLTFGKTLINLFLHAEGESYDIALAADEGTRYLHLMLISFLPNAINYAYSSALREGLFTKVTMMSSISGLVTSFVLNFIFIPIFGVAGAALATIVSRVVEMSISILWVQTHLDRMPYMKGAFTSFRIPGRLMKQILFTGAPLTINETVWAIGSAMLTQCFSYRGLTAVAAVNIASTISMVVNTAIFAMGMASGIILGQILGSGDKEKAYRTSLVLMKYAGCIGLGVALILFALGPLIPLLYGSVEAEIQQIAKWLIWADAVNAIINGIYNNCYYTVRCGGRTLLTFFFDSGTIWGINVLTAFIIAHFTDLNIIYFYWFERLIDIIKCIMGYFLVKKGSWATVLTDEN